MKIFLSKRAYASKPDNAAGMIKCEKNFNLVDIEPIELYKKLSLGHFYHNECGASSSMSGTNQSTFKKAMLKQTQIICLDFDYKLKTTKANGQTITHEYTDKEMPVWSNELLSDLFLHTKTDNIPVSPTFWIESYSANTKTDKKEVANSVHLFYVFEDEINNIDSFSKIATTILCGLVASLKAKGYDIPLSEDGKSPIDKVSLDMFQGIWGSYGKNHGWIGTTHFASDWEKGYTPELYHKLFPYAYVEDDLTLDDIERSINAYSCVKSIEDIDATKSRYLKYNTYFGHSETFKIIAYLKYAYKDIDSDVNSEDSICYNVCKKLLLNHSEFTSESHFNREYKRQSTYKDRYKNAVIKLIGETGAIPMEQKESNCLSYDCKLRLGKAEHLSDIKNIILQNCKRGVVNLLVAAPGTGKTEFAKQLDGKTLVIELFNSIISSEEKFPSTITNKYCGDKYIPFVPTSNLNVCSANKFVSRHQNDSKERYDVDGLDTWMSLTLDDKQIELAHQYKIYSLLHYDNIILDESHLLALSNYRYDIMGKTVSLIKKLAEIGKSRIILMTGTPFGEDTLFDNLHKIEVEKPQKFKRDFNVVKCHSVKGTLGNLISNSLSHNRRVFLPVDSENLFDTLVKNLVSFGIVKKEECFYFSQPHREDDLEVEILDTKQIGNCKILGSSSYMSVGIDIEDYKTPFDIIFLYNASTTGNFCAIEIEQFANRHRKQDLNCFYLLPETVDLNKDVWYGNSWRKILNIKNRILLGIYNETPKIIHLPAYIEEDKTTGLFINEDMFNCYLYYKDNYNYVCNPIMTINGLEKIGWKINYIDDHNDNKFMLSEDENRKQLKSSGCKEFIQFLNDYLQYGSPMLDYSIGSKYELDVIEQHDMFFASKIHVTFSNLYAKNTLLQKWLSLREWFTPDGASDIFRDCYDGEEFNMAKISRICFAIKIKNSSKSHIWNKIETSIKELTDKQSWSKKGDFKERLELTVDKLFSDMCKDLDIADILSLNDTKLGIGDQIFKDFVDGVKLVMMMHVKTKNKVIRIGKKTKKIIFTEWVDNALDKYGLKC